MQIIDTKQRMHFKYCVISNPYLPYVRGVGLQNDNYCKRGSRYLEKESVHGAINRISCTKMPVIRIFLPIIQRIMAEEISQSLLKTAARRIQDYRKELLDSGYSQKQINTQIIRLLNPSAEASPADSNSTHQEILSKILRDSLQLYPTINQALATLLLNLEVEIVRFTQEEPQETLVQEEKEEERESPEVSKEKPKKKKENMRKKKSKNGKMSGLEEIKARNLAAMELEKEEINDNLKKIELLRGYLERRVLMELCQQTMFNFNPFQVQA